MEKNKNDNKEEAGGEPDHDQGSAIVADSPAFRHVRMGGAPTLLQSNRPGALKAPPSSHAQPMDVIDSAAYFRQAAASQPPVGEIGVPGVAGMPQQGKCNWSPVELRPVPAFYPLEKSSRLVEDDTPWAIAARVSECLRKLSVQAEYDDYAATAKLLTCENVEMHLSLWKTQPHSPQQGVVVELQRRKGDSIAFHRYSRNILDAALGELDVATLPSDFCDNMMYSKKVQRLMSLELKNRNHLEHENAVIAIEIAHGLVMKDRMDARQLGLESLCLLTDPKKTGMITAVLSSHVVLLGSTQGVHIPGVTDKQSTDIMIDEGPFQEIREAILRLVQFSRLGEDDVDAEEADMGKDKEMTLLHNLGLAVLANALEVIENPERFEIDPETGRAVDDDDEPEDSKPRSRLRTASSTDVANEFMQQTEEMSNTEILKTLISELGDAGQKPHNATLSAKCIGSLCRASDEAKRRAKELGAKNVVSTALDVGVRTHLKLETECQNVARALERTLEEDDDDQDRDNR